ncbi:MAG: hypothetical protein ACODAD_04085 [Planctomycetota bacterium]
MCNTSNYTVALDELETLYQQFFPRCHDAVFTDGHSNPRLSLTTSQAPRFGLPFGGIDAVFGIGGGKCLDVAKYLATWAGRASDASGDCRPDSGRLPWGAEKPIHRSRAC